MKNTPNKHIATADMPPINVAIPNTVKEKMEAISNLSKAVVALSETLNSTNVAVTIQDNVIHSVQTGITIATA